MKIPNLGEAHWGEGAEQSAQVELEFVLAISWSCGRGGMVSGWFGGEVVGGGEGRGAPLIESPDQPPTSPWTPLYL